ncbi:hypothetical protein B0O99DRAFT_683429 [Bisporella sp. PMI_857]|nr:hypothetical protein B0O99DRAFT_683429 [Bisporella sp. PMI_857]
MHQPRPRPGIHHTSKSYPAPSPEEYHLPKSPSRLSPALQITATKTSSVPNLLPPQSIGSSPSRTDGLTDSQDYFPSPSSLASLNQIAKPVTQKLRQISQAGFVNTSPPQWRSSFGSTGKGSVESHTSSRFLTPPSPPQTPETEKLPYKARRKSSESLIMVKISQKDSTAWKRRRRQNKGRKCSLKHRQISQEPWTNPTCRVPRCQVAPTAPEGFRWLCQKPVDCIDLVVINDLVRRYKGMRSTGMQNKNIPQRLTRRWSSVEYESPRVPSGELSIFSGTLDLQTPPTVVPVKARLHLQHQI